MAISATRALRPARRFGGWIALLSLRTIRRLAVLLPRIRIPRWIKLAGDIAGLTWAPPVVIKDPVFGNSMTIPSILEVIIDGRAGRTTPSALGVVTEELFSDYPKFVVNVAFSCGKARSFRPGPYANPGSRWFNVFVGYYQIDVPRSQWTRPFGYRPDGSGGFSIDPAEIALLGRADWNYFSNYLYGVPLNALRAAKDKAELAMLPPVEIGSQTWDHLGGSDIRVASVYQASTGEKLLDTWYFLNNLWRAAFGQPFTSDDPDASFGLTELEAELLVGYGQDTGDFDLQEPVYRTYVFGGTVNRSWALADYATRQAENAAFLQLQITTLTTLIKTKFADVKLLNRGGQIAHPGVDRARSADRAD